MADDSTALESTAASAKHGRPETTAPGAVDAMRKERARAPWVIESLLMEESATLVSAHPNSLKSLPFLDACLEAVVTKQVWGRFAAPNVSETLFIDTEDPGWLVEARIRGFARGLGFGNGQGVPGFHYACVGPFDLCKKEDRIRELVEEHRLSFIVIRTLQNLLGGRNWICQEDMQPVMAMIARLSRNCPVVLLAPAPCDKAQRRAAGTIIPAADFLTTMYLQKSVKPKSGETFDHIVLDSKAAALKTDFSLKLETEGDPRDPGGVRKVVFAGEGWPKGLKRDAVRAAIEDDPGATARTIADRIGVTERYVQEIRKGMADA